MSLRKIFVSMKTLVVFSPILCGASIHITKNLYQEVIRFQKFPKFPKTNIGKFDPLVFQKKNVRDCSSFRMPFHEIVSFKTTANWCLESLKTWQCLLTIVLPKMKGSTNVWYSRWHPYRSIYYSQTKTVHPNK